MNASECAALLENVTWNDPRQISSLVALGVIDVIVILGNILVIAAVFMSSKLRSVTNLFIVSLAVADLMVGIAVLPFSATWEVFKVWIFGDLWCSIWLAVDVWMCTASILNLCAISLDRYVAVTRPITYPSIMSMKRAKILIACVWVLSFVICFPPLLGWKDKGSQMVHQELYLEPSNDTYLPGRPLTPGGATVADPRRPQSVKTVTKCPWICELTSDTGYVVYSALGSFYIPMLVMLFFYWRIYRAAVHTTTAINQGFRTTKGTRAFGNRFDEQRLTLRIHRGRSSVIHHGTGGGTGSNSTTTTNSAANSVANSPGKNHDRFAKNRRSERGHEKVKISVSYPSSEKINQLNNGGSPSISPKSGSFSSTSPTASPLYAVHYSTETNSTSLKNPATSPTATPRDCHLRVTGARLASHRRSCRRRSSGSECGTAPSSPTRPRLLGDPLSVTLAKDLSPSPTGEDQAHRPRLISKMGKRNIKAQVKRFRMETKAAKTLGIIVGGFIFCWLPFFTLYLIRAFCPTCIQPGVFSVMFWLGYCNSAINPCIYALFSKDFRFAFKRIICRCFCNRRRPANSSPYVRRGSDGSQLGLKRDKARSPSYNDYGASAHLNPPSDSEQNNEAGSDSR
nr:PREDICTED: octopamine receptor Oamb-like isoform X1 [Bemisia tabaci]XP_018897698.1 PREDICTED: octopamine receptor Oamb-like isoform X2 [Bemisia tabaci]